MNGTRECYMDALKRLRHYLEDSIESPACPDADACHAGIDSIKRMEDAIAAGLQPWLEYDFDEDTQAPDGPDTAKVVADEWPVTLQRGYPHDGASRELKIDQLTKVAREVVDDVEAVQACGEEDVAGEWPDLWDTYVRACTVLGQKPMQLIGDADAEGLKQ